MDADFTKMHCCGHDCLLIDWMDKSEIAWEQIPIFAKAALKRHIGVGANSLAILHETDDGINLKVFNSQGEEPKFFNDDLICASRYLFDKGLTPLDHIQILANEMIYRLDVIDLNTYRLELGTPIDPQGEAVNPLSEKNYMEVLKVETLSIPTMPLILGLPGRVVFSEQKLLSWWKDKQSLFAAQKEKPVFTRINGPKEIQIAIWQSREYIDYLLAAGMAVAAAAVNGLCERDCFVEINGYSPFFQWDSSDNIIRVTAGAKYIFSGNYEYEENLTANPFLD